MSPRDQMRARALQMARNDAIAQERGWSQHDEQIFNDYWDNLSDAEAFQASARDGGVYSGNRFNEIGLGADDPLVQQFMSQFGAERQYLDENGRPMQSPDSGNRQAGGYVVGYGNPTYAGQSGDDQLLQDGSRIVRLPDGRYIREAGNFRGETVTGTQRADETGFRNIRRNAGIGALAVLTGGLAANGLMGAGMGAAEGGGLLGGGEVGAGTFGNVVGGSSTTAGGLTGGGTAGGLLGGEGIHSGGRMVIEGSRLGGGLTAAQGAGLGAAATAAQALTNNAAPRERINVEAERLPPDQPYLPPFDMSGIPQALLPLLTSPGFTSLLERGPNNERPWYQSLTDNPLQTIGRGLSLYQMGSGLFGRDGRGRGGNNNDNNEGSDKGGSGTGVNTPQRGPWEPNPITAAQIQNFQYARPRGN